MATNPRNSGNPKTRAAAAKFEKTPPAKPPQPKFPLWMGFILMLAFLIGGVLTLWLTWGFKGTLTPTLFLTSAVAAFGLTTVFSFVLNIIFGDKRERNVKKSVRKAIIIFLAIGLVLVLALTAVGSFDRPQDGVDTGNYDPSSDGS